MLINSDDIKTTKEQIEVMQAFIDGIEIEYKEKFENNEYKKTYCPTWDFANYQYRIARSEPENLNTIELFEVIYYCDIMKEFEFVKQLYLDEDLINKRHLQKTGRSFIIDKDTRQLIKVINK